MADDPMLEAQRWMWATGDYSQVAQRLLPLSVDLVETAAGNGDKVKRRLLEALDSVNQAVDGTCRAPAPYLLAVAHKPS